MLLRPLQVPDSDHVVLIYNSYPKAGGAHAGATVPDYIDRLRDMTVLEEQALFNTRDPSLDANGTPERIHAMQVTPSFFRLIRVPPRVGRGFTDEEGEIGKNLAVILSHGLWKRLFGGQDAINHTVRIDGQPYTVVGVMPADFLFIDGRVQAWLPLVFTDRQKTQRYSNNWAYLGRLRRDATLEQAQAQVDALNAANLERFPETKQVLASTGFHSVATRLQDDLVRDVRPTLYLLWAGALFVLLIGCVNVANLVLARSRVRLKEITMRMALGAARWRIVRQLVTEHILLTISSAVGGLLIGHAVLRVFGKATLDDLPRGTEITIDDAIVVYTLLTAALIGLVLGAIPVLAGLPGNFMDMLREGGRGEIGGRGFRMMRRTLVVAQVAVALVLLIGAGLLFASFRRVLAVDPGFDPHAVLTASISLPPTRYASDDEIRRFTGDALQGIRAIPGVVSAGATTLIPFGDDFTQDIMLPEGCRMAPGDSLVAMYYSVVTPGYFEAMRVPLINGRFFDDRDTFNAPKAVIVDERLANRYWPGLNPVGRRMYEPTDPKDITAVTNRTEWFTVIAVVKEVRLRGFVEGVGDTGAYYTVVAQTPGRGRALTFAARTSVTPTSIASAIRDQIARVDRDLPVFDVQTMTERASRSLATRRSPMMLSIAFGGVALFLSAVGIYGFATDSTIIRPRSLLHGKGQSHEAHPSGPQQCRRRWR